MVVYEKRELTPQKYPLYESFNKRFINQFKEPTIGVVKSADETCDLHLSSDQPLFFVSPKGAPLQEAFWEEPRDIQLFWLQYERLAWGLIALISIVFGIVLFYFWGF